MDTARIERILALVNQEKNWAGKTPAITAQLKLSVSSLKRQRPNFWTDSASTVKSLLADNTCIEAIWQAADEAAIAYAIREIRD